LRFGAGTLSVCFHFRSVWPFSLLRKPVSSVQLGCAHLYFSLVMVSWRESEWDGLQFSVWHRLGFFYRGMRSTWFYFCLVYLRLAKWCLIFLFCCLFLCCLSIFSNLRESRSNVNPQSCLDNDGMKTSAVEPKYLRLWQLGIG
jgi:hypothetical protein